MVFPSTFPHIRTKTLNCIPNLRERTCIDACVKYFHDHLVQDADAIVSTLPGMPYRPGAEFLDSIHFTALKSSYVLILVDAAPMALYRAAYHLVSCTFLR